MQLFNGDCLEVMKKLPDNSVDSIVTDPPYGIDFQSAWRTDRSKWKPKIANDKEPFTAWIQEAYRVLKDGGGLACFTRWDVEDIFREELSKAGFVLKSQIIWDKVVHGMGDLRGNFAPCHENIIFATKGRFIFPGKRPKSVVRVQRISAESLTHPNEKPVELMRYFVEHLTQPDGIVMDCFMGVGATGRACVESGRKFIGIELDPEYCKIAEARINSAK